MESLPSHDIVDIVEKFSEQDGFTPGQVCGTASKEKIEIQVCKPVCNREQTL